MDDQAHLDSHSLQDRPWTTDEIRKHSSNWTLAGDVGLYNLLIKFSSSIISRTHEVENAVDSLVHQTKMASAKINNVINDFHMLSNLQFVENRVYDEEIKESVSEIKPSVEKTKEQREAEMLPKILKAIELGLSVLDTQFDSINVNEISDSEDEEDISSEGRTILEPKDPYEHRPLPYIIGSDEFMKCDYAGLKDLVQEEEQSFSEESNVSETDETSSDEGEPLPLDDEPAMPKFTDQFSQNISDRISSSDESELFGSEKEVNNRGSDSSLDFKPKESQPQVSEKKSRQSSVSSMQSKLKLPQVLPVPILQKKDEDMFADDDNSDDDSPFRKKTGLFTSDINFNEDEKDGDLFSDDLFQKSPINDSKQVKTIEQPKALSKKPETELVQERKKTDLFEAEEDSDDDIFNTLMKTKKPPPIKTNSAESQDSSDKADSLSTPSSAPSIKSVGNVFGLTSDSGTLFDDSDEDDLFASSKKPSKSKKFDLDIPEDNDDLFGNFSSKPKEQKKINPPATSALFGSERPVEKIQSIAPSTLFPPTSVQKKKEVSLFDDDDEDDDIFTQKKPVIPSLQSSVSSKKPKKETSLFDDDDMEDDLFSQAKNASAKTKKVTSSLFSDESDQDAKQPEPTIKEKTESPDLFMGEPKQALNKNEPLKVAPKLDNSSLRKDDSVEQRKNEEKSPEKSKKSSLFDDTDEEESSKSTSVKKDVNKSSPFQNELEKALSKGMPKKHGLVKPKPVPSLFDESGEFDLFSPKSSQKKDNPVPEPENVPEVKSETLKTDDQVEGSASLKVSPLPDITDDSLPSFDVPVDNSNTLNSINKGRARITTKRRKPTRQGRLAALEKSEDTPSTAPPSTVPADSNALEDSNSFSAKTNGSQEPPKSDHKAQEKQKMNLMSQLMSEAAVSKLGGKNAMLEDEDEDDVDIFSEAVKKDRSKSSFSFQPPEQNGIASMFPVERTETEKDGVLKSDVLDDDFFTEPAFKNFRSSVSSKDPPALDLDYDDEDDDLFGTKTTSLPKAKPDDSSSNDLFDDDVDIFADARKEKYEMFPSQVYEDEDDDDIFKSLSSGSSNKSAPISKSNTTIKKVETQQVDAFKDPLSGLLGED